MEFAGSPDDTDVVAATNPAREHDRVEPAAALAGAQQYLIRIESRPRARGYRSNDGGGGGAVRMVVLDDDGRPGLADLRAQRGRARRARAPRGVDALPPSTSRPRLRIHRRPIRGQS